MFIEVEELLELLQMDAVLRWSRPEKLPNLLLCANHSQR